jgi:pSer/pThr/pTyr-binding forkhead associated (FHA) protein
MEWLDRLGRWYQTHFDVNEDSELTPKEVLRKILESMDNSKVEGLDALYYVANRYVLELAVGSEEERSYLLSFLDEQELSASVERLMTAKNYHTKGPLDFTIEEIDAFPGGQKLYVRALFDKNIVGKSPTRSQEVINPAIPATIKDDNETDEESAMAAPLVDTNEAEADELGTPAAWAALLVESSDGRRSLMSISKPIFTIGRSRHGNNDLVVAEDGLVSKRHIRIELEPDGGTTLYDLASTNGTFVNGELVPVNIALKSGDIIEIGATHIQFQRAPANSSASHATTQPVTHDDSSNDATTVLHQATILPTDPESLTGKAAKLRRQSDGSEHPLGDEAIIGRGMTCDFVISEPTVSTQQARTQVIGGRYVIQDLSGRGTTIVNGRPARVGERVPINHGDRLNLGGIAFTFELV